MTGPALSFSDHQPVLLDAVLQHLAPSPGGRYCDATVGLGGHASAVLERSGPDGRLIGLDRDQEALRTAAVRLASFGDRVSLIHAPFSQVGKVLDDLGAIPIDGFVVDLGVSSPQLDTPERGFSFQRNGPLDMRMDQSQGETVADLLLRVDEIELGRILREYGEERYAARIARSILQARDRGELSSTGALGALVARALPHHERHKNPATRTFQALRIAVNQELTELEQFLDQMADCLRPGGRICIIAFHSLEDRIVKHRLRQLAARNGPTPPKLRLLTKHVVVADEAERLANPRSRSAKLRAAERI
ncbi:MAG TPA: 16S rRNA (cytosine(1402)-N(4))-methyltransferase RsmH [Polyangia bacterium]|jgi:16S rRNA (cytosine1402-N4)-methyltransferase|nr:16S rRNA (cytosine(1402)-N(4))-methyltransferase RsmH [Polyangia bacterium]